LNGKRQSFCGREGPKTPNASQLDLVEVRRRRPLLDERIVDPPAQQADLRAPEGGVTHTAPSKYHDEIIPLVFIHTKYGEPIVIIVFRCTIQKVLCLTPPRARTLSSAPNSAAAPHRISRVPIA
jgi:hypothetical protein